MERPISPPPSKRRRLDPPTDQPGKPAALANEIKVYSWNVNGITPFIQPSISSFFHAENAQALSQDVPKASLRDFLHRHEWPTVLFLQEVKINPDDSASIKGLQKAVKKGPNESSDAHDYEAHLCLPSDEYNARGFGRKVYGVCCIIRKDFRDGAVENVREVDWDVEGRFLVIETKASGGLPKLALINVYAVNGTDHPYKDSKTGEVAGTRHNRKLRVHALLQAECRALEVAGFGIIIAGDLNIARSILDGHPNLRTFPKQHCLNRADFEARFFSEMPTHDEARSPGNENPESQDATGLNMIDTFRYLHPDRRSYTYFPRSKPFGESCDRVDYVLVSQSLKDYVVQADIFETVGERGPSDHVPLFAKLAF